MKNPHLPLKTAAIACGMVLVLSTAHLHADTLYWFGTDSTQGGDGVWNTQENNWSTTEPGKTTAGSPPTLSDTAVFAGSELSNAIEITGASTGGTVQVDTAGYVFEYGSTSNWNVNAFSGSALDDATIQASGALTGQISVGTGSTADFSGSVIDGGGTLSLRKSGGGRLIFSGSTVSYGGTTLVDGGALGVTAPSAIGSGLLTLASDSAGQGVLETSGTFTRSLGTGGGEFRLGLDNSDSGGFAAVGGALTLNFGGSPTPDTVTWSGGGNFRVADFVLNTEAGTHTVTLENDIELGASRTLHVGDGAADIDAVVAGDISGSSQILTKSGGGTLRLDGDYSSGNLVVSNGLMLVDGTATASTSTRTLTVDAGAVLGGEGQIGTVGSERPTTISGGLMGGHGQGDGSLTLRGDLTMESDSRLIFGLNGLTSDQLIRDDFGTWTFQSDQQVQLLDLAAIPMEYALLTGLDFAPGYDVSGWQLVDSGGLSGGFRYELDEGVGTIYFEVIPEPSGLALLLLAGGGLHLFRRLRKSSGPHPSRKSFRRSQSAATSRLVKISRSEIN